MRKLLFIHLIVLMGIGLMAQNRALVPENLRDHAVKKGEKVQSTVQLEKVPGTPAYKTTTLVEEEIIGATRYDLQSNSSVQNRIHMHDDGTIGAIWTMGFADPAFPGRGTGYNYFDGNDWGAAPTERIESIRTGWPSYAPLGENGEVVFSHDFGAGSIYTMIRGEKGTGDWSESELTGPGTEISWNRSTTSGIDNSVIQMLYITWPTANGGSVYEGLDGALLYSRSIDGGVTYNPEHAVLDGISSDEYLGFSADEYEWAASQGDNIAFLVGSSWIDLVMMKSTDGGDSWEKTVIWENPYPFFDPANPTVTDTFYCADGDHHLAFDSQGKVHVVFGINRSHSDGAGTFYFPFVDGIGYWNEDMPTFSNNINSLNPYGHPDSELTEDVNLIGWSQDVDGDGELTFLDDIGTYYVGLSSMPQIVIDDMDYKYVVWASVTETYDNGLQNYRHLWARGSWGTDVWGDFVQLTAGLVHVFDECVFPSAAPKVDDYIHLIYQTDTEPGLAVRGDEDPYGDNNQNYMKVNRNELIPVGIAEQPNPILEEDVSQNMPNPFSGTSWVDVQLRQDAKVYLEVNNLMGQQVYKTPVREMRAGSVRLPIVADGLTSGIYFYTVHAGEAKITKKMIIE